MIRISLFKGDGSGNEEKFLKPIFALGDELKLKLATKVIPVLGFNFTGLESLNKKLREPQSYSGVIFTSPRCVEAFRRSVYEDDGSEAIVEKWSEKYIFCVGPSTASDAKELLKAKEDLSVIISDLGNSEDLANKIVQKNDLIKSPLLYPCGNLKTDTLESILSQANIPLEPLTVYSTIKNPLLENCLKKLQEEEVENTQGIIYVFFSPSGVKYATTYFHDLSTKFVIAIGPTTLAELQKVSFIDKEKLFQCNSPTPESLCESLRPLLMKLS